LSGIAELQPWLQPWARWLIAHWPYGQLTSTYRGYREQSQLYAEYLAGRSRYPVAPPGRSYHQFRRAFDYEAPPQILRALGEVWEWAGGTWGGRFHDAIHFEA